MNALGTQPYLRRASSSTWHLLPLLVAVLLTFPAAAQAALVVKYQPGPIPFDPASSDWQAAAPVEISLGPQQVTAPQGGGSLKSVSVRGLHNGSHIGFRAKWRDTTRDTAVGLDTYRDAVALQFPLRGNPSPFMGDAQNPVNIWQWRADDQEKLNTGGAGGYPVEDLNAAMFGTLTKQASQDVDGRGAHSDGSWRVVFLRRLDTGDPNDTLFTPASESQVNAAAWNGAAGERGSRKSVSLVWTPLRLEPLPGAATPTPAPPRPTSIPRQPAFEAALAILALALLPLLWRRPPPNGESSYGEEGGA